MIKKETEVFSSSLDCGGHDLKADVDKELKRKLCHRIRPSGQCQLYSSGIRCIRSDEVDWCNKSRKEDLEESSVGRPDYVGGGGGL